MFKPCPKEEHKVLLLNQAKLYVPLDFSVKIGYNIYVEREKK